ncbi:SDR family NAD(P)-dependent oxidoreductase [Shimia marina]|uniref:C signal n=1 Tax=Shimia marina TaxID=321267 RepID=A0A0N7LRV9_9RHOB|nr:SDR family NAD(P)-dependent oxidoreductase [Shimia marina]CUH51908.1 C signal [Shimia marina]SFE45987.1 NAD(P)-dependent dehydrogenase, short-chain alcohol dehydrogenase family [Shimia marina]
MRALVIGDSGGIGAAVAQALRAKGGEVVGLSRSRDGFDLTQPEQADRALSALTGAFDLIFVASGALTVTRTGPEKSLRDLSAEELAAQFAVNTIGPALVLKHAARLLPRRERGVFAALSARVGSIGDNRAGGWYSYRASKAALNQIVHSGAIELARSHKQAVCVALHPGTVETAFTANYPSHEKHSAQTAAVKLLAVLDGLKAEDSGGFFDYSGAKVVW